MADDNDNAGEKWRLDGSYAVIGPDDGHICATSKAEYAERIVASVNRLSLLTIEGIERHTPEQVEAALINAELMRARIEDLEAIVAKLPKTADGVPITPGMILYPPCGHHEKVAFNETQKIECRAPGCLGEPSYGENDYYEPGDPKEWEYSKCFSSREAAVPVSPTNAQQL